MTRRLAHIAALLLIFLSTSQSLAQGKRVALVIGNSEYKHTPRLENPKNDAADMAAALKKLGFTVIEGRDLDKAGDGPQDPRLRRGAAAVPRSGSSSMPGTACRWRPELPGSDRRQADDGVGARLRDGAARSRASDDGARDQTNILFLDACRDNPLARNLARALGTRSAQIGRGLAADRVRCGHADQLLDAAGQCGARRHRAATRRSRGAREAHCDARRRPATILINVRNDVMQEPSRAGAVGALRPDSQVLLHAAEIERRTGRAGVLDLREGQQQPGRPGDLSGTVSYGEFASIARALIEHYRQQRRAELAAQEAQLRREDEARKRADVERLEAERKVTESRQEELRKALEEARLAREALKAAEQQRAAAAKAAEEARAVAEIENERGVDRLKIAALPKLENPQSRNPFDGTWEMVRLSRNCADKRYAPTLLIKDGIVSGKLGGGGVRGSVSASGVFRLRHLATLGRPDDKHSYSGTLRTNNGSGTFAHSGGFCSGTFTLTRR